MNQRMSRRRFVELTVLAYASIVAACQQALKPTPTARPLPSPTIAPTASPSPAPVEPVADFIYVDGPIITMDPQQPVADAVAVAAGVIVAIGTAESARRHAGPATTVVSLQGRALLPGFVDAHSHFFGSPQQTGDDLAAVSGLILGKGITTTAEMHTTPDLLETLRRLDADGRLGVRTSAYMIATDACGNVQSGWWRDQPPTRRPGEMLRIGGVKVFADGGSCNLPAASYEYLGGLGRGDLYFSPAELARLLDRIEAAGHQAAVHALGDRAVETVLDAFEELLPAGSNPLRHRMEHSAAVRPDLRDRHAQVGVVTTIFGALPACFFAGEVGGFHGRTPPEFLEWEWPWRDLLERNPNAHFAWHADWPVFDTSAIGHLAGFVTRGQVNPETGGYCEPPGEMAGHVITVERALQLMTVNAAYALGRDDEVGSLSVGKLADMVVLSADPRAVEPRQLHDTQILVTVVGGQAAWCAPGSEALCPPRDAQLMTGLSST